MLLIVAAALVPGRLYPFSSTAMWLYLPMTLLVTLRFGAGFGILTALVVAAVAPTLAAQSAQVLTLNDRVARVLLPFATAGMLGTVLGVADLNRRRLASERANHREMEALLITAERLNAAASIEDVLLHIVQTAAELFAIHRALIYTNEGDHALGRYDWTDGVWTRINTCIPLDASAWGRSSCRDTRTGPIAPAENQFVDRFTPQRLRSPVGRSDSWTRP